MSSFFSSGVSSLTKGEQPPVRWVRNFTIWQTTTVLWTFVMRLAKLFLQHIEGQNIHDDLKGLIKEMEEGLQ